MCRTTRSLIALPKRNPKGNELMKAGKVVAKARVKIFFILLGNNGRGVMCSIRYVDGEANVSPP